MRTKKQGVQAARNAIQMYQEQAELFQNQKSDIDQSAKKTQDDLNLTLQNLSQTLITDLSDTTIENVMTQTASPHLQPLLQKLHEQKEQYRTEITQIEQDTNYQNAQQILNPDSGTIAKETQKLNDKLQKLNQELQTFNHKKFQYLYQKQYHKRKSPNPIVSFFRFITLSTLRESSAISAVRRDLKFNHFSDGAQYYDDLLGQQNDLHNKIEDQENYRRQIQNLIKQHQTKSDFITHFDSRAKQELQESLLHHLNNAELKSLHKNIQPNCRVYIAKAIALHEKMRYFENLQEFLTAEIVDRQKRVHSIDKVQRKWSRKPHDRLKGDKSKWLVDVPNMKHRSTQKRSTWIRSMHTNIYHYDMYDHYDAFLYYHDDFLPYDAFAYQAPTPMPYEGFTQTVIPDIEPYREEHNLEKPDYAPLKEAINDYQDPQDIEQNEWEDGEVLSEDALEYAEDAELDELENELDESTDKLQDFSDHIETEDNMSSEEQNQDSGTSIAEFAVAAAIADELSDSLSSEDLS